MFVKIRADGDRERGEIERERGRESGGNFRQSFFSKKETAFGRGCTSLMCYILL